MSVTRSITITEQDARRLLDLVSVYEHKDADAASSLATKLDEACVVAPMDLKPFVVTMNSRITCRDESGELRDVEIVYPWRADASAGRISVLAPLGRALLGVSVGARSTVIGRGKVTRWIVEAIRYQPEAAGDADL